MTNEHLKIYTVINHKHGKNSRDQLGKNIGKTEKSEITEIQTIESLAKIRFTHTATQTATQTQHHTHTATHTDTQQTDTSTHTRT